MAAATLKRRVNPMAAMAVWEEYAGWDMPDPLEFIVSSAGLNRPNLYPRQATVLKIMFLRDDQFTDYDHEVIGGWIENWKHTADDEGIGNNGIQPDIYERIRICKAQKRKWFRETQAVWGRRGSKGHVGALAGGVVLWTYMGIGGGDPQDYYGIDRDKKMAMQVFAGKKEQAKTNQWGDIFNVITGAPCFSDYISRALGETLTVFAPHDKVRIHERLGRGVESANDMATFVIQPLESTVMASRGPAAFSQYYDEMAHVVKGVAKAEAEAVWTSATPALDQFGKDAFVYQPSSPWQMLGQFYVNYRRSLELNPDGSPTYPDLLMTQLTSWDIYTDWEIAHTIPMWPGAKCFNPLKRAMQEYDDNMVLLEKANPETFRVERRSHFAAALNAYLNQDKIATMWKPWPGEEDVLTMKSEGRLAVVYRAHGDPSKSGANFGFAIGHAVYPEGSGLPHVVFDLIKHWAPGDFEDHEIDYEAVGLEVEGYMDAFMPGELTFDQFNSVATIQRLQKHAIEQRYPKQVQIYERTATGALNWKTYETFKTALGMGLVHAPFYDLLNLELTFLQDIGHNKVDHPTSGPVQTKDVADCVAIVVYELIGEQMALMASQLGGGLSATAQGGFPTGQEHAEQAQEALSSFTRSRGARAGQATGAGRRRRR